MTTTRRWAGALVAGTLVAAACGSDDDTAEPDATVATTDAADTDEPVESPAEDEEPAPEPEADAEDQVAEEEPAEEDPADAPADADPIKLAFLSNWDIPAIGLVTPEKLDAAEAAVAAINASGGVDGAPIDLFTCNVGNDAPTADACARDAVDFGAVAVAGLATPTNGSAVAIFEEAGIPIVGAPLDSTVWSSDIAFPLTAGTPGVFAGQAGALAREGATTVRFVATDVGPAIAGAELFFTQTATALGLEVADTVLVPPDQADMSTIVQSAIGDGVDGIGGVLSSPPANIGFVRGLSGAGFDGAVIVADAPLTLDTIEQMSGAFALTQLNLTSEGGEQFAAEMAAHAPDADITPQAAIGWLAVHVIADVARELDEVTSAEIIGALGSETALDLKGMANPVDFTSPVAAVAPSGATRIFQTAVGVATLDGRAFVDGDLVEPFGPPGG